MQSRAQVPGADGQEGGSGEATGGWEVTPPPTHAASKPLHTHYTTVS